MAKEIMLTTTDNETNPFTDYDKWLSYDLSIPHSACRYLGRNALTSDEYTDEENEEIIDAAIDKAVNDYPLLYMRVTPTTIIKPTLLQSEKDV